METQDNIDIIVIENYLDGLLSEQEKEQFLLRLETDQELKKLYQFRLKIRDDWEKARQYETTREQVKEAVQREKSRQRRNIMYAVAASLALIIVVSGIFNMINPRDESSEMAATETDSAAVETYEPQISQPKNYADSGQYKPNEVERSLLLTLDIKADSIIFNWQPLPEKETFLVFVSQENKQEILRKQIQPTSLTISLPRNQIPSGKLIWYIEGFMARDSFELANTK